MVMEMARSFDVVRRMTREQIEQSTDGMALVSVVFAHPDSLVFGDLVNNYGYLKVRSGYNWYLHFAGYCRPSLDLPSDAEAIKKIGGSTWRFSPTMFNDLRSDIEKRSEQATKETLEGFQRDSIWNRSYRPSTTTWHFSGTADLVSLWPTNPI
jgi:hypothetical protein